MNNAPSLYIPKKIHITNTSSAFFCKNANSPTFSNFSFTGLGLVAVTASAISWPILKDCSLVAPFRSTNMLKEKAEKSELYFKSSQLLKPHIIWFSLIRTKPRNLTIMWQKLIFWDLSHKIIAVDICAFAIVGESSQDHLGTTMHSFSASTTADRVLQVPLHADVKPSYSQFGYHIGSSKITSEKAPAFFKWLFIQNYVNESVTCITSRQRNAQVAEIAWESSLSL